jgi:hypothetical protein
MGVFGMSSADQSCRPSQAGFISIGADGLSRDRGSAKGEDGTLQGSAQSGALFQTQTPGVWLPALITAKTDEHRGKGGPMGTQAPNNRSILP